MDNVFQGRTSGRGQGHLWKCFPEFSRPSEAGQDTGLAFSSTGTSYLFSTDLCQTKENVNQSIV